MCVIEEIIAGKGDPQYFEDKQITLLAASEVRQRIEHICRQTIPHYAGMTIADCRNAAWHFSHSVDLTNAVVWFDEFTRHFVLSPRADTRTIW